MTPHRGRLDLARRRLERVADRVRRGLCRHDRAAATCADCRLERDQDERDAAASYERREWREGHE